MGGHLEIGYGECWERGEPRPGGREKAKKKNLKKLKRKGRHCQEVGPNAGQCHTDQGERGLPERKHGESCSRGTYDERRAALSTALGDRVAVGHRRLCGTLPVEARIRWV